jgi:hypothetical protein
MRKSHMFLSLMTLGLILLGMMHVHSRFIQAAEEDRVDRRKQWVRELGLSDLCLFTDARYARHPSMADLHTPFQDYPLSFEHFPSGSMIGVPPHLRGKALR